MSEIEKSENFSNETIEREESEFVDQNIPCVDCLEMFVWSAGEQLFFRDKGLMNPPKRCRPCKQEKNERLAAISALKSGETRQRIEVAVKCAKCDALTTVPFYPSQGRPVYCRSCFLEMNPHLLNGSKPEKPN